MKRMLRNIQKFTDKITENHTSAYAAQSAFFIVLSLIPIILLLLTLVQFTPVTKGDVMTAVVQVIPKSIYPTIIS
ncbi:MAG: YihY/virulence factor BrkB family protein, partial [Lachnospiraceae bacterium]